MSQIVAGFVEIALPSLERLVVVLERAKAAPKEVHSGLAAALERADRVLMPQLLASIDQADLFLADMHLATLAAPGPGAPAAPAPDGARRQVLGGSTPVPVTRGSGGGKTLTRAPSNGGKKGVRRGTV